MVRKVDGPEITGQVFHKQTGQAYGPVTVTASPKVYTDPEMSVSVTSLTTDGTGVFSCYAPPGQYTFTTTAVDAATIEPVEVLGHEGGTGTPQSAAYVPSYVAQVTGDGATDDGPAINAKMTAASAAGGGQVVVPPGSTGVVIIGTQLVIPSGIHLHLTGNTTIRRKTGFVGTMIVNNAINAGAGRDSDIGLTGDPGSLIDGGNIGAATNANLLHVRLAHIDRPVVGGFKITTVTGGKYAIRLADVTDFTVKDVTFNTFSDGLHITGPAVRGYIANIKGTTGDDQVALCASEGTYPYAEPTGTASGDITDIHIAGIECNGSLAALKMIGGTAVKLRRIDVRGIYGTTQIRPVAIFDDTVTTDVGAVTIEGVYAMPADNSYLVQLTCSLGRDITLKDLHWDGATGSPKIVRTDPGSGGTCAIQDLRIMGLYLHGAPATSDGIYVNGASTISYLSVEGVRALDNPASFNVLTVASATSVVTDFSLRDFRIVRSGGNVVNIALAGATLSRYRAAGGYVTGGGGMLTTASGTPPIVAKFCDIDHVGSIFCDTQYPLEMDMSDVTTNTSLITVRVRSANATPIRVKGGASVKQTGTVGMSRDGTQALSVNNQAFKVDESILTPTDGDMLNNTNATPLNGVGVAIWNAAAAKWKNIYTGTTS